MRLIKKIINWIKGLFNQRQSILPNAKHTTSLKTKEVKISNKEKRDAWLASKGYTVRNAQRYNQKLQKEPSHYMSMVFKFINLKRSGKIIIKDYVNKYGIPYYQVVTT